MRRYDVGRMALASLGRQRMRTFLTTAGVVIGVGALVLMVSLGIGVRMQLLRLFETDFMIKTLTVSRAGSDGGFRAHGIFGLPTSIALLDEKDIQTISKSEGVTSVSPNLSLFLNLHVDERMTTLPVLGIPQPETAHELREAIVAGRFWNSPDERGILLPSLAMKFGRSEGEKVESLIGKRVYLTSFAESAKKEELTYTVLGVYDSEKLGLSGNTLWMPLAQAEAARAATRGGNIPILWDEHRKGYISAFVKAKDLASVERVKTLLRNSGYHVMSSADAVKSINILFLIVEGFLACIGGIGLVIALLGIANTMAMAVLERTREIGIMKALGCADGDIRRMFLLEAAMIGFIGGVIGIAGGWIAGKILDAIAHAAIDIPADVRLFHVSLWLFFGTLFFSVVVSALAGWFPSRRAARLDPVRALKYE